MAAPSKFWPIVTVPIENESDVVAVRQRAHRIAELLGFDRQDQTRIATAVSELARNAYGYAGGGRAEFILDPETTPQRFAIRSALTNCDDVAFVFDRHGHDRPEFGGGCHALCRF